MKVKIKAKRTVAAKEGQRIESGTFLDGKRWMVSALKKSVEVCLTDGPYTGVFFKISCEDLAKAVYDRAKKEKKDRPKDRSKK
jgi:hypothetical protein